MARNGCSSAPLVEALELCYEVNNRMKSIRRPAKHTKSVIAEPQATDHGVIRTYLSNLRESGESRVPPERVLAETLKIPRNQVRSVLNKMANEGLIWRQVGDGTYFGQRPLYGHGRSLAGLTNPREVMEARLILEPELAYLAAYRAKKSNILELELCIKHMASTTVQSEWMFWDQRFHRAISQAAENALLSALLETIQSNMDRETWGELANKWQPAKDMGQYGKAPTTFPKNLIWDSVIRDQLTKLGEKVVPSN